MKQIPSALLTLLLFCSPALAWDGKQDNKSVAELELMTDDELVKEVSDACVKGVIMMQTYGKSESLTLRLKGMQVRQEASQYIDTISRVARKLHQGIMPEWARAFSQVVLGESSEACVYYYEMAIRANREARQAEEDAKRQEQGKKKMKPVK